MTDTTRLHLFDGYGVEIEYVIVDRETLAIRPIADHVLRDDDGQCVADLERGPIAWSNELALHLVELKTNGPAPALEPVVRHLHADIGELNRRLEPFGARLMPTGMHPWMDPDTETRLWPYDNSEVYATFHRIFDCRGHGWSNLQSTQLNLPFADDQEFAALHAAIRLVLPIMPALTASTPVLAGSVTGQLDNRMLVYRGNCRRVPSVTGAVVPENAQSRLEYEESILGRIYDDLETLDPDGIVRHEWVNARGSIARFDRYAIEIRVLDSQECARADIAVLAAITALVRASVEGRWSDGDAQRAIDTESLAAILWNVVERAGEAVIGDPAYLEALGLPGGSPRTAREIWQSRIDEIWPAGSPDGELWREPLSVIFGRGCLARRILQALGPDPDRQRLRSVYGELCDCLARDRLFVP